MDFRSQPTDPRGLQAGTVPEGSVPDVMTYDQLLPTVPTSTPGSPKLRFWRIFGGPREKLPFPRAVFTILSENNRREKLLR